MDCPAEGFHIQEELQPTVREHDIKAETGPAPPRWSYLVLAVAVLAMSSGGIWFALLGTFGTPPLMMACWRLTLTSGLQLVGVVYELRTVNFDDAFWSRFRRAWLLLVTSGVALAIHFGSWGWSIARTTLLDSLLLVSSVPLLLVAIQTLRWLYRRFTSPAYVAPPQATMPPQNNTNDGDSYVAAPQESDPNESDSTAQSWLRLVFCPLNPHAPTWLEALGALCGFFGVLVLLLMAPDTAGTSSSTAVTTVAGNLAALLGAFAIIPYLEVGASCRQFMPLFLYAFPVTFVAAVSLAVASLATESNTTVSTVGLTALFGFLGDTHRAGYALGAAAVSGIAGHTLMNLAVKYVSPLVVGVAVLWEPLLGSFLGYFANVQGPPDVLSLVATPLLLGGALLVTLGGRK
ncbi:hypothetical protein H257_08986 [Aphanomyces astaci]|uniref:EamA domain-containing protein n=1 Tax=Aphanomyces astaci TaxID=112090 RepID=W4GDS5_APHAT|nr:hypothetical protein H257_08986 [Aphanomyces astaci]ETV77088.1 hypothetical protein H257_08986 [Aphanomyces astaci]|eukprot:XP_009833394.1 hypothetical protein H257_08986 [Aphanomyces astaci]